MSSPERAAAPRPQPGGEKISHTNLFAFRQKGWNPVGETGRGAGDMQRATGTRGGDQGGLRAYNRRMILNVIRQNGPMPKAEIARVTGLTAQSASVIVNELLAEGLVVKQSRVRGRVGQPFTPIALDPQGALSLGVKIGRRSLEIALVDFTGTLVEAWRSQYGLPRPREVMALIIHQIGQMTGRLPEKLRRRIIGIGIAAPGQISGWADLLGPGAEDLAEWDRIDICGELRTATGLPAELWNDATAACAAEMVLGQGISVPNALYIYVGTFIGGGVVLDGRLYHGLRGNAGAIGSMPVPAPGGGFEQLIRQASLLQLDRALAAEGIAGEEVRERVRAARLHPVWLGWRTRAARGIAYAVAAALAVVDFEAVVLDAMLDAEDVASLRDEVAAALEAYDLTGLSPFRLVAGTVGFSARSLGAAILPLVRSFSPDQELLVKRVPAAA